MTKALAEDLITHLAHNQSFLTDAGRLASVDWQAHAGNELGLFRLEKKGSIGNIPSVAHFPTQGNPRITPFCNLLIRVRQQHTPLLP